MNGLSLYGSSAAPDLVERMSSGGWQRVSSWEPIPLTWSGASISTTVLDHYRRWLVVLGISFDETRDPWLPLGAAGPVLILAHHSPSMVEPWLPIPCFQPVELSRTDYEALLEHLAERLQDLPELPLVGQPGRAFPARFILPCSVRAALQFLVEYFPQSETERGRLLECCSQTPMAEESLPAGYAQACERLSFRRGLVDLSLVRGVEASLLPDKLSVPSGCRVVACKGMVLWVASSSSLSVEVEDRLLNELGDGWRLRVLLRVDRGMEDAPGAEPSPGRRAHVKLSGAMGVQSLATARRGKAEIVLSEREIADLERYDPRRGGLDARKVVLKEISAAIRHGASDLHLEPGVEAFRIRARVDGLLEEWFDGGFEFGQLVIGAAKELLSMPAERYIPQDGSCVIRHGQEVVNVRVSSFPIRKCAQKLVLRFLPRRGKVPALDSLLDAREARMLARAARAPQGLVLVCGPTGSGKTTTIFSTLASINTPERNLLSLEDPVEYELEGVSQAELDQPRGVGWEQLLKGFLRQDPDAGMLGEIRDYSTAETAVRQALTGHVVFASLHTLSCAQTLERLADMGVRADMLASSLSLVVSQRLVRRLCPVCRKEHRLESSERNVFERLGLAVPDCVYEPELLGCSSCRAGYRGRLAVLEMLPVTEEVGQLIARQAPPGAFVEWMKRRGFPSLFEAALVKVSKGETSFAEASEWQSLWEDFDFS